MLSNYKPVDEIKSSTLLIHYTLHDPTCKHNPRSTSNVIGIFPEVSNLIVGTHKQHFDFNNVNMHFGS